MVIKRRLKLHTLLLFGYSMIIILLIVAMSLAAYRNSKQLVLEKSLQYQKQQMDHLRDYMALHIREAENAALAISENAEVIDALLEGDMADMISQREDRQRIINILASTANTKPYLFSINVVSGRFGNFPGRMINSPYHESDVNPVMAKDTYLLTDSGWTNAFDGGFIRFAASDNSNFLHYYQTIRYRNGANRIATVVVTIDPERIMNSVFGRLDMSQGALTLLGRGEQVLYSSTGAAVGSRYGGEMTPTNAINGGVSNLVFVREVTGTGLTLVYDVAVSAITTGIGELLSNMVVIGFCVLLLSIPAIGAISWWISRPVRNLARDMENVEKNGFRSSGEGSDIRELDSLWRVYGRLLERIRSLIAAIRAEQERKRRAQVKLLQAQINPHFIYNSIELISWTARRHGVPEISEIVYHLGRMLRTALNRGEDVLTIARELEHVESYLELQRYKYENSFVVHWRVDEGVKAGYTVKLLLQPLVENCICHGFRGVGDKGEIFIAAEREERDVVFTIRDNGCGMDEEAMELVLKKESRGYGVHNIEERVRLWFGEGYGLRYSAVETGGIAVTLRIPFIEDPAAIQEESDELSGIFD